MTVNNFNAIAALAGSYAIRFNASGVSQDLYEFSPVSGMLLNKTPESMFVDIAVYWIERVRGATGGISTFDDSGSGYSQILMIFHNGASTVAQNTFLNALSNDYSWIIINEDTEEYIMWPANGQSAGPVSEGGEFGGSYVNYYVIPSYIEDTSGLHIRTVKAISEQFSGGEVNSSVVTFQNSLRNSEVVVALIPTSTYRPTLGALAVAATFPGIGGSFAVAVNSGPASVFPVVAAFPGVGGSVAAPARRRVAVRLLPVAVDFPSVGGSIAAASGVKGSPSFTIPTGIAQIWGIGDAITPITVPAASGNPTPTYAAVGILPDGIAFDIGTRVISGTPTVLGSGTITIRATNSEGSDDWTINYAIIIIVPNQAPTVVINTNDMVVDGGVTIILDATVTDPDNDLVDLTILWTANPDVGSFVDNSIVNAQWLPPVDFDQVIDLTLLVTDPDGLFDSDIVRIAISTVVVPDEIAQLTSKGMLGLKYVTNVKERILDHIPIFYSEGKIISDLYDAIAPEFELLSNYVSTPDYNIENINKDIKVEIDEYINNTIGWGFERLINQLFVISANDFLGDYVRLYGTSLESNYIRLRNKLLFYSSLNRANNQFELQQELDLIGTNLIDSIDILYSVYTIIITLNPLTDEEILLITQRQFNKILPAHMLVTISVLSLTLNNSPPGTLDDVFSYTIS